MKNLFTCLSKKSLSNGNGPMMDRQCTGDKPAFSGKLFASILFLLLFGIGNAWGVDPIEEYVFEEDGGTTVSGWTFTNGTTTNTINQSGYWLLDAGSTKDYIITSAYDLSTYESATVYADITSYGSGTHNALKIEISYNGGSTWTQYDTYTTTTSYVTKNLSLSSTLTSNIKIRLSNTGTSGRGVRVQNFKLEVTYTPTNHTVNWYVNDPVTPASTQTDLQGTTLTDIPTPTSSDCDGSRSFIGWTENSSYTHATDAPSDLLTNTTGMKMPKTDKDYYAVFANIVGGTITITAANCAAGAKGDTYAEKGWTTTSTDGNDYSGIFKIYGNSSSASMQFNNGQTPCFYNTTEFSEPITNITMTYASGTSRTWTPRVSSSNMQNSSSASNGTDLTGKAVSSTTTWDIDPSDDYRWVYLGVGGGASFISSIEITYGSTTNYNTSCIFDLFIDIMHDNETIEKQGSYSMPSALSDESKGSYCEGTHYHFLGWVEESEIDDDGTLKDGYTLYPAGDTGHTANNKTYYAVWGKEEE